MTDNELNLIRAWAGNRSNIPRNHERELAVFGSPPLSDEDYASQLEEPFPRKYIVEAILDRNMTVPEYDSIYNEMATWVHRAA